MLYLVHSFTLGGTNEKHPFNLKKHSVHDYNVSRKDFSIIFIHGKKQNQDHGLLVLTFTDSEACIYHYHALGKLFQVAPHLIGNMDTIMAQLPASPPDRL
jgi:hypothetical protein